MQNPAPLLKLTSLDRILVRQEVIEARLYGPWEDWAYFISYERDDRLNVANTIGHARIYIWDQIESIEKREPIKVRALTEKNLLQYFSTNGGRRGVYTSEYATAEVLFGSASAAIIHADDMRRLRATVNRGVMAVCTSKRGRGADAKGQAGLDARRAKKVVAQFLASALAGTKVCTDHDLPRA